MDIFEAIYTRRAVRQFTDEKVDRNDLLALIDAAIQAPSALDLQPWAFFVVQDRAALERFSTMAKAHLLETLSTSAVVQKHKGLLADPSFDVFNGASTLIVVCAEGGEETEIVSPADDCCLAAENLMLAARGKNLATCWIGFARPWLVTSKAKAEVGMPRSWAPVAPIVVGHPRHLPPPPPRREPHIVWYGKKG
jgi:nitroreductase